MLKKRQAMTGPVKPEHSHPRKIRRVLGLVGWNALLLATSLALIAVAEETWLRLTIPFAADNRPTNFVPRVGVMLKPNVEIYGTNAVDYWIVSRTNSLGFLDREPLGSKRTAESCHVAIIGDSFVEANNVPIDDKFHVRIEELATRELPHLDITTSAFGIASRGTIQQLPLYDEYTRRLHPKLVVLVFVPNDFIDNATQGKRMPYVTAKRAADGTLELRPPDPDYEMEMYAAGFLKFMSVNILRIAQKSYFLQWLYTHQAGWFLHVESMILGSTLPSRTAVASALAGDPPTPFNPLDFTAFALDEFKERTGRDGNTLVILATHRMTLRTFENGVSPLDGLKEMAATLGIPVIDQADYILRQGGGLIDAQWRHDAHWNLAGHRWAAEALLEWLKDNQEVCDGSL